MEHMNLLQRMEFKAHSFSKGQKRLAEYITKNYDIAAYLTASKLGKEAGVSESTVVRFAYQLEYEGYPEKELYLGDDAKDPLNLYTKTAWENLPVNAKERLGEEADA